jgi:hypothetical protein
MVELHTGHIEIPENGVKELTWQWADPKEECADSPCEAARKLQASHSQNYASLEECFSIQVHAY